MFRIRLLYETACRLTASWSSESLKVQVLIMQCIPEEALKYVLGIRSVPSKACLVSPVTNEIRMHDCLETSTSSIIYI